MHIATALELHRGRRDRSDPHAAPIGQLGCPWPLFCTSSELWSGKIQFWCLMGFLVGSAVVCIGRFEATRLTIHVLMSPCTVVSSEVVDVDSCTLCDGLEPSTCEVHPIATARLAVTFRPLHAEENVTGFVWYCKGRDSMDPCQQQVRFLDQVSLQRPSAVALGPVACTVGEVFSFMQEHSREGEQRECYYSSRDLAGEDVWLSMPSPGLVDHAWFRNHLEYPVMLALGGLVLLSVLLGCLALEGAELWASGLV